ncbi:E3 ubiquitin-protein ligase CHFR-like isoform X1 [Salvelinus namaycush]|uniref:E3 ubiquitin-protein ligase CHFR n=3 Tax=Salvelinus namaycush TaxID=8040 RepID=A0A8U1F4W1_SALNM|nr:E3 ubiquitin-protein ligase CHFR-like isoform X1 [Salvelinus namaycush]XP_038869439.1 E3 ubiquitin-protein ligase CHFR-like isoform X1 [Salvelinus namaycush]
MEKKHGRSQPWGKLVKVDTQSEVLLVNRECTVGRRKGCDLSFPANKLVSGDHCKIVQDKSSGLVWLEDTSTNGTVINMSKLVKKQIHMLQNGDVIYFVYRKNEPEQNIAYMYQSIKPERTFSQDTIGGATRCSVMQQKAQTCPVTAAVCVSVEPFLVGLSREQQAVDEPQPSTSSHLLHTVSSSTACSSAASLLHSSALDTRQTEAHNRVTMLYKEEEGDMEPERKRRKTDSADKDYDFGLPHTSSIAVVGPSPAKVSLIRDLLGKAAVTVEEAKTDKMEESLTCIICQDLLHDCVSLQPCMHTFCAACYSGWMERSSLCPTCRCPVERIRKNHILNNLVEAYFIQHPEKCRSEEDLKSMDSRNKITRDMLQPKIERSFSDEEGSSDYLFELSDNDSDTSDIGQPVVMCRQCPGYRKEVSQVLWATGPDPLGPAPPALLGPAPPALLGPAPPALLGPVLPVPQGPAPPALLGPVLPAPQGPAPPALLGPVLPAPLGPAPPALLGPVLPAPLGPAPPALLGPAPPALLGPAPPALLGPAPPALLGPAPPALLGPALPALLGPAPPALLGPAPPALLGPAPPALLGPAPPALLGPAPPALLGPVLPAPLGPVLPAPLGPAPPTPEDRPGKPPGARESTLSTCSDVPTTAPQDYTCPPLGSHVICTCCLQPMPDRRAELIGQQLSAQQCVACLRPFCHMYWGCQRIGCQGCLARFSELNLTDKCLDGVLNSNNYESEILQSYLSARGMSWRDMLQEGLQGLQQGTFYLSDYRINSNAILCFCCGLRAFGELAYKYRQNIPASALPAVVTSRPDCYWGRNCRTQVKAHHATKFNHICEQTRFKS